MGYKVNERTNGAAIEYKRLQDSQTDQSEALGTAAFQVVKAIVTELHAIERLHGSDIKDARSTLRREVYGIVSEETARSWFTVAMNTLQKEWYHLKTGELLADHLAERGEEHSVAAIKRTAEQPPEEGGTIRGHKAATKRAESKDKKAQEAEKFYALNDADAVIAMAIGAGFDTVRAVEAILAAAEHIKETLARDAA